MPHSQPPPPGAHQLYRERHEWRDQQTYLPTRLRLVGDLPDEEWWNWRGHDIHVDRYPKPAAPIKVILLHGGGGNGRLLAPFAAMIRDLGGEALCPDLPGYGLTVRAPELTADYGLWCELVTDLVTHERSRDDRPIVLWGLSLGGLLAYLVAARSADVAGVMATTLADTREPAVFARLARNRLLGRLGLALLRGLGGLLNRLTLPIRWLSPMTHITNHAGLSRAIANDRLAGGSRVPLGFLRSLLRVEPAREPEQFTCPLLLVHPGADRWTPLELSRSFFDRLAGPKRLVLLEGCGHFPLEEPGLAQLEAAVMSFLATLYLPAALTRT